MDRRSVLKLFGITAAAATAGVAIAAEEPLPELQLLTFPPPLKAPEGMTYQWKRVFFTSEEPDLHNIADMLNAGWTPVPYSRHADELPLVPSSPYWVEQRGLVLMEKPTAELTPPRAHPMPWEFSG